MKTNMDTFGKWLLVIIVPIAFLYFLYNTQKNEVESKNYTKCLEAMQKALPDPNDDSRASFLQNCQK